ncbi:hypothetical protein SAZ10_17345 [Mesorhizobium sp. BAC0120]|uniref:COG3904 family protein n=1 Tax=Mesorhizobium sp. BAC0120 TaxID=3090670 RepID=UPI00298C0BCF|nr:hypothetical protein [Mesorhizobium sp. BAC0120]MDW6023518.1 hypothetical protein [Mesorhizobium sp. BAC0120]
MSSGDQAPLSFWRRFFGARPDEAVLRAVFASLVALTLAVLGDDLLARLNEPPPEMNWLPGETTEVKPYLPSVRSDVAVPDESRPDGAPKAELGQPMVIELVSGGRLEATGAITPGTAERFKTEIERRGDYVKTVVLNSPGGSVQDALEMGRLIREKGLGTLVEKGGYCASSCPLVFAGGATRTAQKGAFVGVHQVIALPVTGAALANADDRASFDLAQKISAECQRHLVEMGVDPRVWIHAMETPPDKIFYFTSDELEQLRLVTISHARKS